jgi:hypothetical protein
MNRPLTFLCAVILALLTVSSTCLAQSSDQVRFTLEPEHGNPAKIHASFHHQSRRDNDNNWSTGFMPSELVGMEASSFHGAGTQPLRFAVERESGRLDCAGNGGNDFATGICRFTASPVFSERLVHRGIGAPTFEQAFALMAVNARGELLDALAAAHYAAPRIDDLIALSALGVDGRYIGDMAHVGYRPSTIESLIEFKALGITSDWIAGFARVGYASVPADALVQMRALGITPEFIAGYQRVGYHDLPVDMLVQLKALDITPEFVRTVAAGGSVPPVSHLVELKMFSNRH